MRRSRKWRSVIRKDCTRKLVLVSSKVRLLVPLRSLVVLIEATDFTGISAPYEAPINPEVHIKTAEVDIAGGVKILLDYLTAQKLI